MGVCNTPVNNVDGLEKSTDDQDASRAMPPKQGNGGKDTLKNTRSSGDVMKNDLRRNESKSTTPNVEGNVLSNAMRKPKIVDGNGFVLVTLLEYNSLTSSSSPAESAHIAVQRSGHAFPQLIQEALTMLFHGPKEEGIPPPIWLSPAASVTLGSQTIEANARFIVTACNSHDRLVEALASIKGWSKCQCREKHGDNPNCCVLIADTALAEIERQH